MSETSEKDCVFCDRTQLEERLIAETDEYYVVASLGQITDGGYVLIIPKKHIPCIGAFSPTMTSSLIEIFRTTSHAVEMAYRAENETFTTVTAFEHGVVGQSINHAHLHLIPVRVDFESNMRKDFPNSEIEELNLPGSLQAGYEKRNQSPYLYFSLPHKDVICWNPEAPAQYLRIVAAELLGRPERANWRNMDPELDKQLWTDTVVRLKQYFK